MQEESRAQNTISLCQKAHQTHPNVLFTINGADARNPIHTTTSN
jgi:hypothetical protein